MKTTSMRGGCVVAACVAMLRLHSAVAQICESGVWTGEGTGDMVDTDSWVGGAVPTSAEFALVDSDDGVVLTLDDDFSVYSMIIGSGSTGDIVIEIGEEVPTVLIIGDDPDAEPCVDADATECGLANLTVQKNFEYEPIGQGISVDFSTGDVTTGVYNAFNFTCAYDFVSNGTQSYEVVSCPFDEDNYTSSTLSSLSCIPYTSEWCSAGVLEFDEDTTWSDGEWVNGELPQQCVLRARDVMCRQCVRKRSRALANAA